VYDINTNKLNKQLYYETRKDNKTNKKTIPSYMSCPSMELESAWRLRQRINMLSYTGCSLPNTGYTAINITTQLQYFTSGRLATSTDINIRHTKYISPPAVITHNTSLQTVTYNITGSLGHSLVPHNVGETILGTVSPYRTSAADVGNVKCMKQNLEKRKPKLTFF
jgi:hypothetical protein